MRYNDRRTLGNGVGCMGWFKKSRNEDLKNVPESVKRQYRCAFTGHRPEKVIGSEGRIIVELRREIEKAIADGYKVFLTGMSRGVDLWAADIVLELRRYNKDLKLVCVIPFEGMEDRWPADWKKHYDLVRRQADFVWVLSDRYSKDAYQKRNQWLVDHASRLIAVFNGSPSGTGNTIRYAREKGVPTHIIEVSRS